MLDVCLLGTGGMMPLPQRWLTSLLTRYNGSSLLIDCGEGTQITMKEHGWSFKSVDTVCFTHYHADHISGLPGMLLAMANSDRTEPLTMVGPKGLSRVVGGLRVIAPELPFEIRFRELHEAEESFSLNGFQITAFRLKHNMICYGYALEIPRAGKFDADRARAQDIPLRFWNPLQKGETIEADGRVFTPDMVLGESRKGIKVVYTTDTRPIPSIAAYAAGADLFICEGMYGDEEKEEKAVEHRHMTVYEAAELARKAQPAAMWLTHYSPSMMHPEWYLKKIRKIFPVAELGEDGKYTMLRFEED